MIQARPSQSGGFGDATHAGTFVAEVLKDTDQPIEQFIVFYALFYVPFALSLYAIYMQYNRTFGICQAVSTVRSKNSA